MNRTIVDIHVLQTVPPSNLNRDDTGSPKTAMFGGVRRARVSSQAWKRATRVAFSEILDTSELGVRTKRLVEIVANRVNELDPTLSDSASELAAAIITSTGIVLDKPKRKKGEEPVPEQSKYLVFISALQIDRLARKAIELAPKGNPSDIKEKITKKEKKELLDRGHSVDLALFGRMVADVTDLNVDASAQVAHAISVHAVNNEYDYFTAVDDVKAESEDEDAGAGMIGTVEFNSSTLYRYATVNVDGLRENLGDDAASVKAVEAFIRAFVESMPTGKQNTFANRTLPDAVLVLVRDGQPVNLVGAFEEPVRVEAGRSRSLVATERLIDRAIDVDEMLGRQPIAAWVVALGDAKTAFESGVTARGDDLQTVQTTLPELAESVGALVSERLGAPQ